MAALVWCGGSETAKRGLEEAIKLTKALGAKLKIVHIVDDSALALNPETGIAAAPLVEDFAEGGKEILEEARKLTANQGIDAESCCTRTSPAALRISSRTKRRSGAPS